MVEGGAQIIEQFLSTSRGERPLVDSLVVTVAPVLVPDGIGISAGKSTVSAPGRIESPLFRRLICWAERIRTLSYRGDGTRCGDGTSRQKIPGKENV